MAISRALRDEFNAKLEAFLDERDDIAEKRRRLSKALKGEVSLLDDQIAHVRRVLKGIEPPQLSIPGTEIGERKRDSVLQRILDAAARIRETETERMAKEAQRTMDEVKEDLAQENGGVDFTDWKKPKSESFAGQYLDVPGGQYRVVEVDEDEYEVQWWAKDAKEGEKVAGGYTTPIAAKSAAVKDWKDHRAPKRKKAQEKPAGLVWMKRDDGSQWAAVPDGAYQITRALDGNWTAVWAPAKGEKSIVVGGFGLPERQAKSSCEAHFTKASTAIQPTKGNGAEKKGEIAPLAWRWTREDVQEAEGIGGSYEVVRSPTATAGGGFTATFRKAKSKRAKVLGLDRTEAEAKDACTVHYVEACADAKLANAGDGGLNRGDLKGPPTKHKRARS